MCLFVCACLSFHSLYFFCLCVFKMEDLRVLSSLKKIKPESEGSTVRQVFLGYERTNFFGMKFQTKNGSVDVTV